MVAGTLVPLTDGASVYGLVGTNVYRDGYSSRD